MQALSLLLNAFSLTRLEPKAEQILNDDHYGLEKVKERILEFLAVGSFKSEIAGSILLGRALAPIDQMIGAWKGFVAAQPG